MNVSHQIDNERRGFIGILVVTFLVVPTRRGHSGWGLGIIIILWIIMGLLLLLPLSIAMGMPIRQGGHGIVVGINGINGWILLRFVHRLPRRRRQGRIVPYYRAATPLAQPRHEPIGPNHGQSQHAQVHKAVSDQKGKTQCAMWWLLLLWIVIVIPWPPTRHVLPNERQKQHKQLQQEREPHGHGQAMKAPMFVATG